jgi:hypothetical protein
MNQYKISFRILETRNKRNINGVVAKYLGVTLDEAEIITGNARRHTDFKLILTAEQLGNLQAMRIIENLTDNVRYLCEVETIIIDLPKRVMDIR